MKRRIDEFHAKGRKDCAAYVTAILYEDGRITATADEDKITEAQLLRALESTYPGHQFKVAAICGRSGHDAYYIVDGTPKPTPRPEADEGSAAVNPEVNGTIRTMEGAMARIAVNICDLDALTHRSQPGNFNPVALLLKPDFCTEHSPHVWPDKNWWDSAAVVLDGPASRDEERTTALVDLLQTVLGPRKIGRRVRCYREGPRGGWKEIRP